MSVLIADRFAVKKSNEIFARVGDDEMNATTLQDLGLCYYYQMKYKEAMHYYESACHLIMEKVTLNLYISFSELCNAVRISPP